MFFYLSSCNSVSRAFLEGATKTIAKLEMLLSLQDKTPMAWFTEIDSGLGNGRLSVDELRNGLTSLTSRKVLLLFISQIHLGLSTYNITNPAFYPHTLK